MAESVVVIKKLLQLHVSVYLSLSPRPLNFLVCPQPKENKDLIIQVAKLTDTVTVSECRLSS